jgi:hypothetical protein
MAREPGLGLQTVQSWHRCATLAIGSGASAWVPLMLRPPGRTPSGHPRPLSGTQCQP